MTSIAAIIEAGWNKREVLSAGNADPELRAAVDAALAELDNGKQRVAEPGPRGWIVNEWLKKAVLLSFRLSENSVIEAQHTRFYDKVPLKYADYTAEQFADAGTRVVPDAIRDHAPAVPGALRDYRSSPTKSVGQSA